MTYAEAQLISRARNGDADSFELLIQNSRTKAYNIALRYMQNEEDAMDALQESYIKIFRALSRFKEESSFDTWVYRIVVNTCTDMLRKAKQSRSNISIFQKREDDSDSIMEIPDSSESPERSLERKEEMARIFSSIEMLPKEQREAILLRDVHGFTYEEIAGILSCSDGTIKSRISRGRMALRKLLLE